jgi:hypothetical protein
VLPHDKGDDACCSHAEPECDRVGRSSVIALEDGHSYTSHAGPRSRVESGPRCLRQALGLSMMCAAERIALGPSFWVGILGSA